MKAIHLNMRLHSIFLAAVWLVVPCALRAQSPPGPMTGAAAPVVPATAAKPAPPLPPPRTTILGAWKINRDESDDTRKRRDDSSDSNGGYGGRRGGMGGGYPGGGHGGYGRRGESDDERQKMHELLSPPEKMTLSMTGAEVDLLDDRDRKRAFMTDGRKLQKSKDDNYREIAAHWEGNRLLADEKLPGGEHVRQTFELSSDGRQLDEEVNLDAIRSRSAVTIHYVYNINTNRQ